MQLLDIAELKDYIALAKSLAQEFATTAAQRDELGGNPKYERDRLRESGLLNLIVPKEYGGIGENWTAALKIVREFASVDSSIAHILV